MLISSKRLTTGLTSLGWLPRHTSTPSRFSSGFTIVELLIVVVIIAILAAITIVAYNSIQQRATNTVTANSVAAYARALSIYAVQNSAYPVAWSCLGPAGTICVNTTQAAYTCFGMSQGIVKVTFSDAVKTVASSITAPSVATATCSGDQYGGAYYGSTDGKNAKFYYYLAGDVNCPTPGGTIYSSRQHTDDVTMCVVALPALP